MELGEITKNPMIFNYIIMVLYILNSIRWAVHGNYSDMMYWLSAFMITATVTWGYSH